jgi:hypothetical protein
VAGLLLAGLYPDGGAATEMLYLHRLSSPPRFDEVPDSMIFLAGAGNRLVR